MRRVVLLAFLALAACAPRRRHAPAPKQAKDLAPLGPCPRLVVEARGAAADGQRQDLDGAAGGQEWARFGRQIDHLFGRCAAAHRAARRPGARRAGAHPDYWASVDKPDRSGLNDVPWSAAFISWDIESAGVPRDLFCPDQRHTIYVERMVERASRPGAAFIPHRLDERAPQVGDLHLRVARRQRHDPGKPQPRRRPLRHRGRGPAGRSRTPSAATWANSVTRSVFPLDDSGFLSPISGRPFFTVIENRLP